MEKQPKLDYSDIKFKNDGKLKFYVELLPRHPEDTGYPVGESPVGRVDPAIQPDRAYLRTGSG